VTPAPTTRRIEDQQLMSANSDHSQITEENQPQLKRSTDLFLMQLEMNIKIEANTS